MAKRLHPKIQALRDSVGHMPMMYPIRKQQSVSTYSKLTPAVSEDENERLIKQYFCLFGVPDDYRTQPEKGAFKKSIEERGPNSSAPGKIIVLNQHRAHMPVCVPKVIREDEIGLYAEYEPDEGIAHCDELIIQIRKKTINNGSYGFNYVWDKMEYDEKNDVIRMYECSLEELSPVTFGSQRDTFVVRRKGGLLEDDHLEYETEEILKQIPRKFHMQIRSLLARHISLAEGQPIEQKRKSLKQSKPKQRGIDYNYLLKNI